MGAVGQIGKTQVFATWKGIPYVRRHVVPANPNTTGQQTTRSVFSFLSSTWKQAPALLQAPWTAFAKGQPLTNRNAFIGKNLAILRPGTDMTGWLGSPGAKGGLPPTAIAATAGASQLTIAFTNPTAPTGWTLTDAVAACMLNTDPHTATDFSSFAAEDDTTFNSVVLTGLTAAEYVVAGWLVWTKPDGTTAYSVSAATTGTPT